MIYALDACAMFAYIQHEPGYTVVDELLSDPSATCYAHMINIVEVYYNVLRISNEQTADKAINDLIADGVIIREDAGLDFGKQVGKLKARGGISLADCFCIALAQKLGGEVVTTDHHEFDPLVPLNIVPIRFIR